MNTTNTAVYGDSWYAAAPVTAPERPSLTSDTDVDVCVIGGGLAGLTVAREVARRGWSVAVLEAKRVAGSASGRNCGLVLPGFAQDIRLIVERVGIERARELWALSEAGAEYVRATIRDTGMSGIDPVDGWLDVSRTDNTDEFVSLVALLGQDLGVEIEGWPAERVRETLKSERYFSAIHFPKAFHINPPNYALGLANAAESAGVRIFENTRALSFDPGGVRKRIVTSSARLRAAHVVLAGGAHLGALMPRIAETLLPITTFVAVTAPLGERLNDAIRYRGAVSDAHGPDRHYRVVAGDRLMWAGGLSTWNGNAHRWAKHAVREIGRIYPQLGRVKIDYAWSGVLGLPLHKMPQIGEISPGVWLAGGFGGHGLNTTAMAGELIARAILDGDDRWRLFLPFELMWAGGVSGRAVVQAAYWADRMVARKTWLARRLSRTKPNHKSFRSIPSSAR